MVSLVHHAKQRQTSSFQATDKILFIQLACVESLDTAQYGYKPTTC